jgi:hypothetical protein
VEVGRARRPTPKPGTTTPGDQARVAEAAPELDDSLGPIPWHLKLLAAAVALYLGFRAYQGVEWVVHQF